MALYACDEAHHADREVVVLNGQHDLWLRVQAVARGQRVPSKPCSDLDRTFLQPFLSKQVVVYDG